MHDPEEFSGTRPVSAQHALDTQALGEWLARHLDGFSGPLQLASFKGGQSNPTYKISTPDADYVLRTKPAPKAQLLPSAHAIEREFKVMQARLDNPDMNIGQIAKVLGVDGSFVGRTLTRARQVARDEARENPPSFFQDLLFEEVQSSMGTEGYRMARKLFK